MEFYESDFEVMECACRYAYVICLAVIIACDVCDIYIRVLCRQFVASVSDGKPTYERFHKESEEERGEGISL